jgi:hypothetical protein
VEDHAVGHERVELDDLLLLDGVVALDDLVAEAQPGGEPVVGGPWGTVMRKLALTLR